MAIKSARPSQQPQKAAGTAAREEHVSKKEEERSAPPAVVSSGLPATQEQLPEFMRGMAGRGTERLTSEDVELPRIKLLQALSPEVQEGDNRPNSFYHTVAEANLGAELIVVPLYVDIGFILWRPRGMGGGILARAADGIHWDPADAAFEVVLDNSGKRVTWRTARTVQQSRLDDWGSTDPDDPTSQPAATRMYNVVVWVEQFPQYSPAVVTLQRSGISVARKFMSKLKIAQAPCFGLRFVMKGEQDQNAQGQKFFNMRFTGAGLVQDEQAFEMYHAIYERFRAEGIRIRDIEGAQREEAEVEGATVTQPAGDKF